MTVCGEGRAVWGNRCNPPTPPRREPPPWVVCIERAEGVRPSPVSRFCIHLSDRPTSSGIAKGRIVLGGFEEPFHASLDYWSPADHRRSWQGAILRIVAGTTPSALVTSMAGPVVANFIRWWPMYRVDPRGSYPRESALPGSTRSASRSDEPVRVRACLQLARRRGRTDLQVAATGRVARELHVRLLIRRSETRAARCSTERL